MSQLWWFLLHSELKKCLFSASVYSCWGVINPKLSFRKCYVMSQILCLIVFSAVCVSDRCTWTPQLICQWVKNRIFIHRCLFATKFRICYVLSLCVLYIQRYMQTHCKQQAKVFNCHWLSFELDSWHALFQGGLWLAGWKKTFQAATHLTAAELFRAKLCARWDFHLATHLSCKCTYG